MEKFFTSVTLNKELCKGCINCIKRCPTQAIRVRNGKAVIKKEFCIDCGECIRVCPYHAKEATYDKVDIMKDYDYIVALPAPSLYAQFNNLDDINILLTALIKMGFDDVFEVGSAAELVSEVSRSYIKEHKEKWPIINTACPSVVRLIQVRFPNLIDHLLPLAAPVEIAAKMARDQAIKETGLASERIGLFFISPCPAKVTAVKSPTGMLKSEVDAVLAIKDVYPILLPLMKESMDNMQDLRTIGRIGISWGGSGGEASGLLIDNYLAADGIENVIRVLEDLEDEKLQNLEFIELNACSGGCVGGVLTVENPYAAKVKLKRLRKYMPVANNHMEEREYDELYWTKEVEYQPVFKIGNDLKDSFTKMAQIEELYEKFPKLDCGSCGAPTCKALAEDIVRNEAKEKDCIHILREYIHKITDELIEIDKEIDNR
ncbi:MAG TPA: 4Fe-4S dicluster domain-containing protein [Clostridiales bacterium]|nr:4Fe-4S dicluster domain-containing protein [Clostridiales bacterium]